MPERIIDAKEAGAIDVESVKETLAEIMIDMNVPTSRRNIEDFSNLVWLQHQIRAKNIQHPRSKEASQLMETLVKSYIPNTLTKSSLKKRQTMSRGTGGTLSFSETVVEEIK